MNIEQSIMDLVNQNSASCIHLFEPDPNREGKYRSIEKFSISIGLDGKLVPNFYFTEVDVWDKSKGVVISKKNKHSKRACILLSEPVHFEIKEGKRIKRKHGVDYVKKTVRVFFSTPVYYTDGHRYEKGE